MSVCVYDGCNLIARSRGFCRKHYEEFCCKEKPKCNVEDCNKVCYCNNLCTLHYQRFKLYGRTEKYIWGQTQHPLYFIWNDGKNKNKLCKEWNDFKQFLKDVGEKPGDDYRFTRIDKKELFGPTNFKWKKFVKIKENETNIDFQRRRRLEREKISPGLERDCQLKREFGITLEDYNTRLKEQNFVCKICSEPEITKHHVSGKLKSLAIDHCHKTGKIRGILCQRCNRVLGKIKDSVDILDKMKAYLNADC